MQVAAPSAAKPLRGQLMSDCDAIPTQLIERIKHSISSTLEQHPEGLSPKQLFDSLQTEFNRHDMQEVLSSMYQADNTLMGKDRKLRIKCTQ